ncbi:2-polyprenyl-6-methoxyphenol hydroxylase-like FAD-dependent oxidoreductase [Actinoplanes campanulatus]|uniref:2-polyprenyl-6-methoxyphenol hydroxylase-like FAD-dependent oxidoreductase n=1 Tax=Actinoplanes campanulatus TaxID=113559 RepID=A0A7W5AE21_9ACTN|nr:FAD-dependent monooxygenase [Actinoplanes campanulatus]MBB3094342.1 2-polyprenyl-6-methoxyphenol hydroxylase-like FAD-dependent oxidoreductase [Actinoplanes campanulatus]GGN20350.1 FAD-dependent oxidoreductase [Actinoplanes campanulatus]GID35740.1 FAD-dependent oxidoreductase [Actinoplanes campanulatus]
MTKALVIGGGIAGCATAIALQAVGYEPVVYEAYPAGGDDAGAFLTVMGNGMAALRALDAHRPVIAGSYPAASVEIYDAGGRLLETRGIGDADDAGPRTLLRSTLYRALQGEAVSRGVRIEHGRRLVHAGMIAGGGVRATFADGGSAAGDILVGADGIHSATRTLIDPDAPRPRYTGQAVVYGYASSVPAPTAPDAYHMIFGSRAFFGYTAAPDGRTWWFARIPGPQAGPSTITAAQWRERALLAFADDASPAAAVIRATGDDVTGGDSYDVPTTPIWHRGSMVLAGDAAHAASPAAAQGASMALEDAVALARCLREQTDAAGAFAAYEAIRREPTEQTVAASAQMSRLGTSSPYADPVD